MSNACLLMMNELHSLPSTSDAMDIATYVVKVFTINIAPGARQPSTCLLAFGLFGSG